LDSVPATFGAIAFGQCTFYLFVLFVAEGQAGPELKKAYPIARRKAIASTETPFLAEECRYACPEHPPALRRADPAGPPYGIKTAELRSRATRIVGERFYIYVQEEVAGPSTTAQGGGHTSGVQ
jgi:hypothetical protein